jgi:protein arginine N-methyltransferase 7
MFFVCVGLPGTAGKHFVPEQGEGFTMQQLFAEVTPARLSGFSVGTVTMMNDWHYPMLNDHNRTAFYKAMLTESVTGESVVLDLGAGTGLLSVLAAQAGAKRVYAVEANRELAEVSN